MGLHERRHPEPVPGCFGCKLIGLSFGIVPGGYRDTNSATMFDRDAVLDQLGAADGYGSAFSKERQMDRASDFKRHYREFQDASDKL